MATKADKLSKSQCRRQLDVIRKTLELPPEVEMITFSSETGQGVSDIMEAIEEIIQMNQKSGENS